MISLVCAVHNRLPHNRLFWETLCRYTFHPFELIVVDNASTDGSGDYFRGVGAAVLPQERNLPYPEAMNLGTAKAAGEYVCHINNDVVVGVHWDRRLLEAMERHGLDIVCPASIEFMPTLRETRRALRRWRRIGKRHDRASYEELLAMWARMYGPWEDFCARFARANEGKVSPGINGHTVMLRRSALEALGPLDERFVATDWDLYLTARKREALAGDVKAPKVVFAAYVHHFMQATARSPERGYEGSRPLLLDIRAKWPQGELETYWPFPADIHAKPTPAGQPLRWAKYHVKRLFDLYERGEDW